MPKRAAEDSDSAESSETAKPADSEISSLQRDGEGNLYLDLGSLKRASVSVFRGKAYVNLREYYTDKSSGEIKPGKKGITLDPTQWGSLVANVGPLTKQLGLAESGGTSSAPPKSKKVKEETKTKRTERKPPKKKKKNSEDEIEDEGDYDDN